jgi:outer membrane protein assembly factor BamB
MFSGFTRRAFAPFVLLLIGFSLFPLAASAQTWTAKLDDTVVFYQATDVGVIVTGTKKSLYAVDGTTGEVLWRRKESSLDGNDVAPIPGTDLVLLSFEKGSRTRVEAADILSGDALWQSEKLRGAVMQMSVSLENNLLAVVMVREGKGRARAGFKRHPVVHVLDLTSGEELWKNEIGDVEMMPTRWDDKDDVEYSLDNYHPPAFLDGRLYLFYEGVTSFDARTGKERLRERFRVNEEGLALTEAESVYDEAFMYTSGRGHVRAISRTDGDTKWEAKDLGLTPELILAGEVLFVRTGGQFTQLKDGETKEHGPYGVSAIDARSGKILWRYKGADKGITNLVLPDSTTIAAADHDDLIILDAAHGKRRARVSHGIKGAAFALLNEAGQVVIGGQEEIAAFDPANGQTIWRAKYSPPGRSLLRTVAAIGARAASLYFRFGGTALVAFRGLQVARAIGSLSWSGLAARSSFSNLQALATSSARARMASRFRAFGLVARVRQGSSLPGDPRQLRQESASVIAGRTRRVGSNVEQRLLDRIDPAEQLARLSRFLLHRDRLAALRGQWMYFYTDFKGYGGHGLAGVNINNGRADRVVRLGDVDDRFISDEVANMLYAAAGNRLLAYSLVAR